MISQMITSLDRELKLLALSFSERKEPRNAHHLHGNFGEKLVSNGTGIFFGTENRNGIELYLLQNTGKFFTFSRHEAWHW